MAINQIYHAQYRGDFTATGASITGNYTFKYLRDPSVSDPLVYQATRGNLNIPATATVDRAFLVWVTDKRYAETVEFSEVWLRTPASRSDQWRDTTQIYTEQYETVSNESYHYFAFTADITDLVRAGGAGDYWIYNFYTQGAPTNLFESKAGWSIYAFYRDETASYKDLSFYAGLIGVGVLFQTPVTFTISGIRTPSLAPVSGHVGTTVLNATAGEFDSFYVNTTPLSDPYTPPNDYSNSISTINNALMDTWPPQSVPADVYNEEFQTKVIALSGTEIPTDSSSVDFSLDVPGPPVNQGDTANDLLGALALSFELYSVTLNAVKDVAYPGQYPRVGDTLTYTLQITNTTAYATGIDTVFTDVLPANTTYVPGSMQIVSNTYGGYTGPLTDPLDADVGMAQNNAIVIHLGPDATPTDGGTLQPGDSVVLSYQATINGDVQPGDLVENVGVTITTSLDTGETFIANAPGSIRVNAEGTIDKAGSPARLPVGSIVTYTITATNTSADPYAYFDIVDTHDTDAFVFLSATLTMPGVVNQAITPTMDAPGVYRYHVATPALAPAASAVLTVRMFVPADTDVGRYNDVATLETDLPEVPSSPIVPVDVLPNPIVKVGDRGTVQPGGTVMYTLTFTNVTDRILGSVAIVDAHDSDAFAFVSAQMIVGGRIFPTTPTLRDGEYVFAVPSVLEPGMSVVINVVMRADANIQPGVYRDIAWAEYEDIVLPPSDPVPVDVDDVVKTAGRKGMMPGEAISYAVTFANTTANPISDLVITDDHDSAYFVLDAASYSIDGGAQTPIVPTRTGNAYAYAIPETLAPESVIVLTQNMHADAATPYGTYTDRATVTFDDSSVPSNEVPVDVVPIYKSSDRAAVTPGGTVTYTIEYQNTSGADIADLRIVDNHDNPYFSFASATYRIDGGAATAISPATTVGGRFTFAIPATVAADATVALSVTARVADDTPSGTYHDTAWAEFDGTVTPPTPEVPVVVETIAKYTDQTDVARGGLVTYTITFVNETGDVMTDAVIYDRHDSAYFALVASSLVVDGAPVSVAPAVRNDTTVTDVPVDIPVGAAIALTLTYRVDPNTPAGAYEDFAWLAYGTHVTPPTDPVVVVVAAPIPVTKTVDRAQIEPGDALTYTITAQNTTGVDIQSMVIADIPDSAYFAVTSATYAIDGGAAQPIAPTTGANGARLYAIPVPVPDGSVVVLTVDEVASMATPAGFYTDYANAAYDGSQSDNTPPVVVEVVAQGVPAVDKSVDRNLIRAGDTVTYTLTATNPTGAPIQSLTFVDTPDSAHFTVTSAAYSIDGGAAVPISPTQGAGNARLFAIPVPIPAGATVALTIVERADAATPTGIYTDTARVLYDGATTPDTPPTIVVVIETPEPIVNKGVDRNRIRAGDALTYTLTAINTTGAAIQNLVFVDAPDSAFFTVDAATYRIGNGPETPVAPQSGVGNTRLFPIPEPIPAGATVVLTVHETADADTPEGFYEDAASVIYDGTPSGETPPVVVEVVPPSTPVIVSKAVDTTIIHAGDALTYTLTATNATGAPIQSLTFVDAPDSGYFTVTSATYSIDGGAPQPVTPQAGVGYTRLFPIPVAIPAGATVVLTLHETASPNTPEGFYADTGSALYDGTPTDETPPVTVEVVEAPEPVVTKGVDRASIRPGDALTYTLTATNATGAAIQSLTFIDAPDSAHFTVTSATYRIDGGAETPIAPTTGADNARRFAIPQPIPAGAVVTLTINEVADADTPPGTYSDTASVIYDGNQTPETPPTDVVVTPEGPIVTKVADHDVIRAGDTLTYAYHVINTTGSAIESMTIVDTPDSAYFAVTSATYRIGDGAETPIVPTSGAGLSRRYAIPGPVAAGAIVTLTVTETASASTPVGTYRDTASVIYDGGRTPETPPVIVDVVPEDSPVIVTKGVDRGYVYPGDTLTYTIRATNRTGAALPSLTLYDTPDSAFFLVESASFAIDGGAAQTIAPQAGAGNTRVYPIPVPIPAGATLVLTLRERASLLTPPGYYEDVASGIYDGTPTNVTPPVTVLVLEPQEEPEGPIVTKVADRDAIRAGETLTYTYSVINTTGDAIENMTIVDTPDSAYFTVTQATYRIGTGAETPIAPTSGAGLSRRYSIPGPIAAGAVVTLTVTETVSASTPVGAYRDSASVIYDGDRTPETPPVIVDVVPDDTPVIVAKGVDRGYVHPGDVLTYTINARNLTGAPIASLTLYDTPDSAYFTVLSATYRIDGGASNAIAPQAGTGNTRVYAIPEPIPAGATVVLTLRERADRATPPGYYDDFASGIYDGTPTNTTPPVTVLVIEPQGPIVTKDSDRGAIRPGDALTYTLTATNTTGGTIQSLTFIDAPDSPYFTVTSATYRIGSGPEVPIAPTPGAGTERWFAIPQPIPAGATVTLTIHEVASASTPAGTYRDTARVVYDGNETPDTPPTDVIVTPPATPVVTKNADRATVRPGDAVTYTIRMTNTTGAPIQSLTFLDTPDSAYFVVASATYSIGGAAPLPIAPQAGTGYQRRYAIPGTIPAGATVVLTIVEIASADTPAGTYTDTAGALFDGIPTAETPPVDVVVIVTPPEEPVVTKTADRTQVVPGGAVRFTVTVTNTTGRAIANATVVDEFDSAYFAVNAVAYSVNGGAPQTAPFTVDARNRLIVPIPVGIPAGATVTVTILATAAANIPAGRYTNRAHLVYDGEETPDTPPTVIVVPEPCPPCVPCPPKPCGPCAPGCGGCGGSCKGRRISPTHRRPRCRW